MKLYQRTCDNCQESCTEEVACSRWQPKVTEEHLDCLVKLQDIYRRNGKTYGAKWPIVKDLLGYGIIVEKDDWNKTTYKLTYYGLQWVIRNPKLILLHTTHLQNEYTVRRNCRG